jgi:hypothetical protein
MGHDVFVFVAADLERQNLSSSFPIAKGRALNIERYGMVVFVDRISAEMAIAALNGGAVLVCCALIFIIGRELGAFRAHDLQRIMTACFEREDALRIRAVEVDSEPIGKNVVGKLELPGADKLVLLACVLRRSRGVGREAREMAIAKVRMVVSSSSFHSYTMHRIARRQVRSCAERSD